MTFVIFAFSFNAFKIKRLFLAFFQPILLLKLELFQPILLLKLELFQLYYMAKVNIFFEFMLFSCQKIEIINALL